MAQPFYTISIPFRDPDRGLLQKVVRLQKKLGGLSKTAVCRMGIVALWEKHFPKTEGAPK